eukprot:1374943-Rhodomonas_salina.4
MSSRRCRAEKLGSKDRESAWRGDDSVSRNTFDPLRARREPRAHKGKARAGQIGGVGLREGGL